MTFQAVQAMSPEGWQWISQSSSRLWGWKSFPLRARSRGKGTSSIVYCCSPWFTLIHLNSPWFTLIHLDSPWFTLIHLDSPWFTLRFTLQHSQAVRKSFFGTEFCKTIPCQIWHVEPYGEASIGPIIFEPFQHAQCLGCIELHSNPGSLWYHVAPRCVLHVMRFRTTLYVRNNLTTLHPVELNGHGGSSRLVFPDGILAPRTRSALAFCPCKNDEITPWSEY